MSAKLSSYLPSVGPDTTDAQKAAAAKTVTFGVCKGLTGTSRNRQLQKKPKLQMK